MGFFDDAYTGTPPWEIGRPQPSIVAALAATPPGGALLDVGCGTGENALHAAGLGFRVLGVDVAARAVEQAIRTAAERGSAARFRVHDALRLAELDRTFDVAIDSGCFHALSDDDQERYVAGLHAVLRPGGVLHLLTFSEHEPEWGGPRRLRREQIAARFREGFTIEAIEPARYDNRRSEGGAARAWLARIRRDGGEHQPAR